MAVAAFVISLLALLITYLACRHAGMSADASARSADAAEATYRESISCRIIADVAVERGKNRPRLRTSGRGYAHNISYKLTAEYQGGAEKTVEGERSLMAPDDDSTIDEIPPGNCVDIRGEITWDDSSGEPWSACRSKDGKWVVVRGKHTVESLPN